MLQKDKRKMDTEFRNKEFRILVATESYEVGTHSPHEHNVFRSGWMRNAGVIIQEFSRARRGGEQSNVYLLLNEHKDDIQLIYWIKDCKPNKEDSVKKKYQELWRWILWNMPLHQSSEVVSRRLLHGAVPGRRMLFKL